MSLSRPPSSAHDAGLDRELMEILEQYLAEVERGGIPDPDDVLRRHPERAEQLRSYLSSLEFLQRAAGGLHGAESEEAPAKGEECPHGRLGDYRIVREVGRGGMGVVYEAEQISLGRRVALKVLPMAAVLDERQLQRFRNEAQAAAALHHAHIVPVHGIGCERGVHYYAMQFIDGQTLSELVTDLRHGFDKKASPGGGAAQSADSAKPSEGDTPAKTLGLRDLTTLRERNPTEYYRQAAQLVIQVAEALDYAHMQGVLHRDIKPSNLILDSSGKVWVTDFGLARMEANPGVTLTGDLVGTLRYMSPEQLLAKRGLVDHRADVYALGATFYELLTLQPAFPDSDRQELLRRVTFDEPALPRKIRADIPVELETIVLKAMAKSTGERYATAGALADDLRKFLDNRPIEARRPNLLQRLSKWSLRHRAVVATVVLMTILGLAASTAVLLIEQQYIQAARRRAEANIVLARRALTRERQQRARVERERQRAEENLQKAFDAVDQMLAETARQELSGAPQMEAVRRRLLDTALDFYRELMHQKGNDRNVAMDVARAHHRAGQVLHRMGRNDEAAQSLETAVGLFGRLALSDLEIRHELARSLAMLGRVHQDMGGYAIARGAITEGLRHARAVAEARDDNAEYRFTVAEITLNMAALCMETSDWPGGESSLGEALQIHQRLVHEYPQRPEYQDKLAENFVQISELYRSTGRSEEARDALRQSLQVRSRIADRHPHRPHFRAKLALEHNNLGALLWNQGSRDEAERHWREAIRLQEVLVRDHAESGEYQFSLAASYHNLAVWHKETGSYEAAVEQFEEAAATWRMLGRRFPWSRRIRRELALELKSLGDLQAQRRQLDAAAGSLEEAYRTQEVLLLQDPDDVDYAIDFAGICVSRGKVAARREDHSAALEWLEEARDLSREVLKKRPEHPRARRCLQAAETACEELQRHGGRRMSLKA